MWLSQHYLTCYQVTHKFPSQACTSRNALLKPWISTFLTASLNLYHNCHQTVTMQTFGLGDLLEPLISPLMPPSLSIYHSLY